MRKQIILLIFMLIFFSNLVYAQPINATLISVFNYDSCATAFGGLQIASDVNRAYIRGFTGGNLKIMSVDISNPSNPVAKTCFNQGAVGGNWNFKYGTTVNESSQGYLTSGSVDRRGDIYLLTDDGDTITNIYQSPAVGGARSVIQPIDISTNDNSFFGCILNTNVLEQIDVFPPATNLPVLTFPGVGTCEALTKPFIGKNTGTPHIIGVIDGVGYQLVDLSSDSIVNNVTTGESLNHGDRTDVFNIFDTQYILILMSNIYMVEYMGDGTIEERGNISLGDSVDFISNDTFISGSVQAPDSRGVIFFIDYSNPNNLTLLGNITVDSPFSSSTSYVEYVYPYIYAEFSNASGGQGFMYIYEYFPSGAEPGVNKKPKFNTLTEDSGAVVNTSNTISMNIANPETTIFGESVLVTHTCEYQIPTILREETFDDNFNFTSLCGTSTNIGIKNNVNFGLGMDLSGCSNDNLLLTQPTNGHVIISFDIYATNNGTAFFELVEFDGDTIQEFSITYSNTSEYLLNDGNNTLLSAIESKNVASTDIPIRFYIQLSMSVPNPNINNQIFWATNYFSKSTNINEVYCDDNEFCYIGNYLTVPETIANDYFSFRIINSSGNLAIDNYKVELLENEYPEYVPSTELVQSYICNYNEQGTFTARTYLGDVTYGHNFLNFRDTAFTVSITGLGTNESALAGGSSIGQLITNLATISGFSDDGSLILLALIVIGSFTFGAIRLTDGNVIAGLFSASLTSIFFFYLNWLPLIAMVLIVILAAGMLTLMFKSLFTGGGE